MIQIIAHAIGDYMLQNDWMAAKKGYMTKDGYIACFIHCLFYTIPFLLIGASTAQWVFIFSTHFLIDKYKLATYWVKLINWNWGSKAGGFADDKPVWLWVWLLIIVDNTLHVICNYIALTYL